MRAHEGQSGVGSQDGEATDRRPRARSHGRRRQHAVFRAEARGVSSGFTGRGRRSPDPNGPGWPCPTGSRRTHTRQSPLRPGAAPPAVSRSLTCSEVRPCSGRYAVVSLRAHAGVIPPTAWPKRRAARHPIAVTGRQKGVPGQWWDGRPTSAEGAKHGVRLQASVSVKIAVPLGAGSWSGSAAAMKRRVLFPVLAGRPEAPSFRPPGVARASLVGTAALRVPRQPCGHRPAHAQVS